MTQRDCERYSRQTRFYGLGEAGQERLLRGRAVVVGCGALGSFHAGALLRVGVRHLRLIDRDYVEESNLQRQWLYDQADADEAAPKAIAAARHLRRIDALASIEPVVADLTPVNARDMLAGADVILDGTDNFETRFLLNDYSVATGTPWVYGAAVGSYGLVMPVLPGDTACLACVYPEPPGGAQPTCETAGVLGPLTSLIASLQATEAIKILAGKRDTVTRRITTVDVWTGVIRQVRQPVRDPECAACGRHELRHLEGARLAPIRMCGRNAVQIHERVRPLSLAALKNQLAPLGEVRMNDHALRFFTPPYELTVFPDGRAIVKGTTEFGLARSLYARYVGN